MRQKVHVIRGEQVDLSDPRNVAFAEPVPLQGNLPWEVMSERREIFWMDYANPDPRDWRQSKAFHDQFGHRFVAAVPMNNGSSTIGFLGLAWDRSVVVQPTESRMALCRTLAQR